ncbi:hypothetical protein FPV67DRAFT_616629 [Lyophyllum atratum]|nr:hypothetical protein FPV67DRAFT_616629 [Lyophyllum atratum]
MRKIRSDQAEIEKSSDFGSTSVCSCWESCPSFLHLSSTLSVVSSTRVGRSFPSSTMANYLPVLLVSVVSNSIPDDSSVSTLPRGQVDYLSHNWEEEDVWRSWRNMTRQKNEIANGIRLENASWRTWWKQRNGLGTVTPETLNWLKDSDVTWLYGPLHTAVDWSPPPKPAITDATALDLSTSTIPTTKPILKHRSISQLLTSDLPTSPVFSPAESEDEAEYPSLPLPLQLPEEPGGADKRSRPALTHTKSDTYITRWGPSRTFRKDSPPRIDPPAHQHPGAVAYSPTNLEGYFSNSNQSSDSAAASAAPSQTNGQGQKKRHISFNTFVEQCIAIEKPKTRSDDAGDEGEEIYEDDEEEFVHHGVAGRYPHGRNPWGYDDGYEEDAEEDSEDEAEAVSLSMWDERYSAVSGSDSDSYDCDEGVGEEDGGNEDEEGDGIIEMRSSFGTYAKSSPRSQSTASSSSSASTSTSISNSTSSTSGSPDRTGQKPHRRLSTSTTSTYRPISHRPSSTTTTGSRRHRRVAPPLIRTPAGERPDAASPPPQPTHVTIAPIAPTILKTGPNGYFGHAPGGWVEGFGDEGGSDDGLWGGGGSRWWSTNTAIPKGKGRGVEESDGEGGQTPVELVYVPPFGSNYSLRAGREGDREREQRMFVREREREAREKEVEREGTRSRKGAAREVMEDHEDGFGNDDQDVYRRRTTLFSVGDDEADGDDVDPAARGVHMGAPVPTVVVRHDAYDYFAG